MLGIADLALSLGDHSALGLAADAGALLLLVSGGPTTYLLQPLCLRAQIVGQNKALPS